MVCLIWDSVLYSGVGPYCIAFLKKQFAIYIFLVGIAQGVDFCIMSCCRKGFEYFLYHSSEIHHSLIYANYQKVTLFAIKNYNFSHRLSSSKSSFDDQVLAVYQGRCFVICNCLLLPITIRILLQKNINRNLLKEKYLCMLRVQKCYLTTFD